MFLAVAAGFAGLVRLAMYLLACMDFFGYMRFLALGCQSVAMTVGARCMALGFPGTAFGFGCRQFFAVGVEVVLYGRGCLYIAWQGHVFIVGKGVGGRQEQGGTQ